MPYCKPRSRHVAPAAPARHILMCNKARPGVSIRPAANPGGTHVCTPCKLSVSQHNGGVPFAKPFLRPLWCGLYLQLVSSHKGDAQRATLRHQPLVKRAIGRFRVADGDGVPARCMHPTAKLQCSTGSKTWSRAISLLPDSQPRGMRWTAMLLTPNPSRPVALPHPK